MERPYNAPILTNTIDVTETETSIHLGHTSEYESFLFDNQGDETITITLGISVINLASGMYIEITQDEITSLKVKTAADKTSILFYKCQGYKRLGS